MKNTTFKVSFSIAIITLPGDQTWQLLSCTQTKNVKGLSKTLPYDFMVSIWAFIKRAF